MSMSPMTFHSRNARKQFPNRKKKDLRVHRLLLMTSPATLRLKC